ncbi:MAG: phospholipid/cholesterol/gamma-HCH transport system ATP-binding protein [Chlamydiales bacterium]
MSAPISESRLAFERVALPEASTGARPLAGIDLRIAPGGLALIRVPRGPGAATLGEAALGLLRPFRGQVRYKGDDWAEVPGVEATRLRGTIGRVYEQAEWVSNLNVDENVILASCHHSARAEEEIVQEALGLARHFGLSELTSSRPHRVGHGELRACALVRAFLGAPDLLVLERPLRGVVDELLEPLLEQVRVARSRGAGVLWLTPEERVFEARALEADVRYVLEAGGLRPSGGD